MEALIFGTRAARDIMGRLPSARTRVAALPRRLPAIELVADVAAALRPLRGTMSSLVGVARDERGLNAAIDTCDRLAAAAESADPRVRDAVEVGRQVASAALSRRESRGTHFRRDFAHADPRLSNRTFVAAPLAVAHGS
jgi:L-aspartate oxidase